MNAWTDAFDKHYEEWLSQDVWEKNEFVRIACGLTPYVTEAELQDSQIADDYVQEANESKYLPFTKLRDLMDRAIASGSLEVRNSGRFKEAASPIDFISWAVTKGIDLPDELFQFYLDYNFESSSAESTAQSAREFGKLKTKAKHARVQKVGQELQRMHPDKPNTWIAKKMAKDEKVSGGLSPGTIYKLLPKKSERKKNA